MFFHVHHAHASAAPAIYYIQATFHVDVTCRLQGIFNYRTTLIRSFVKRCNYRTQRQFNVATAVSVSAVQTMPANETYAQLQRSSIGQQGHQQAFQEMRAKFTKADSIFSKGFQANANKITNANARFTQF